MIVRIKTAPGRKAGFWLFGRKFDDEWQELELTVEQTMRVGQTPQLVCEVVEPPAPDLPYDIPHRDTLLDAGVTLAKILGRPNPTYLKSIDGIGPKSADDILTWLASQSLD